MLKNISKVLISNAVLSILGIITSFVFPIILSIEDYAYYQEYILYLSYINICHLGIASGMFLNYAGKNYRSIDREQYKSEIYLILCVLSIFTLLGAVIYGVTSATVVLYVTLTIFPQCLIASFQAVYQAWERFTEYSIINAAPKVLFILFVLFYYVLLQNIDGNIVVCIYMIIMWFICEYLLFEFWRFTRGIKSKEILSISNLMTTWNGFLITLGNYVNILFHSIDKQFVKLLYSTVSFAQYSFAMSMQNIMMIFITSLANPFYPRLAKSDITKEYIENLKKLLFIFGAYSGCAYFAVSFFVEHFVKKYVDSLTVVSMFFAVFPAMAVINVIYINLYKIKKMMKKYIFTLIGMLCVATVLNIIAVLLKGDNTGISFATMASYYIWLFFSQRHFDEITINLRDIIFLVVFFAVYFLSKLISNNILGFICYGLVITIWSIVIYKDTFCSVYDMLLHKFKIRRKS